MNGKSRWKLKRERVAFWMTKTRDNLVTFIHQKVIAICKCFTVNYCECTFHKIDRIWFHRKNWLASKRSCWWMNCIRMPLPRVVLGRGRIKHKIASIGFVWAENPESDFVFWLSKIDKIHWKCTKTMHFQVVKMHFHIGTKKTQKPNKSINY